MNDYYIVAYNENIRIININKTTNLGEVLPATNLAYIDYITSKFDEETFRNKLLKQNLIDSFDTPLYIVKKNNRQSVSFNELIFKSEYTKILKSLELTTLRKRNFSRSETSYLIDYFSNRYNNNPELYDIANYILFQKRIENIIRNRDEITYLNMRNLVASLNMVNKYKFYNDFIMDEYKRDERKKEIFKALPEEKDTSEIKDYTFDLDEIKNSKYDNEELEEQFKNNKFKQETIQTATLEDLLRIGMRTRLDYTNERRENERKFRR